jgi:hypothetical protein
VVNLQIISKNMKFREFQNIGHVINEQIKTEWRNRIASIVVNEEKSSPHNRPFDAEEIDKMKQAIMLTQFKNEWHTLSKALQKSSSTRIID